MRKLAITELQRLSVPAFKESAKIPLVILLDDIRSMHNIGSVFRTADAFKVQHICLCGITACPPRAEIHKAALGAEDSVSWSYHSSALEAVHALKSQGYIVYAVEQVVDSISLAHVQLTLGQPYALVLGNEVKGVQQTVIDACQGAIEIPQFGTKHSLNVSVSAGMVMWECAKQLMSLST